MLQTMYVTIYYKKIIIKIIKLYYNLRDQIEMIIDTYTSNNKNNKYLPTIFMIYQR